MPHQGRLSYPGSGNLRNGETVIPGKRNQGNAPPRKTGQPMFREQFSRGLIHPEGGGLKSKEQSLWCSRVLETKGNCGPWLGASLRAVGGLGRLQAVIVQQS